ncbi:MAG: pyruvate, water dikinase, partial [Cyanobacteria bacterium RYN_339]|nr:pyruvate, water dikinase [Cyanobacteria bacterium RYN_339]
PGRRVIAVEPELAQSLHAGIAAGARVPAGLVVPPETLAAVLKAARLTDEHAKALEAARKDDFGLAEALAAKLLEVTWPKELAGAIAAGVAGLGATRVAVRSSGTLEDQEASAAAGVYASKLDVDPNDVFPAINHCWAAAFAGPALGHALVHGQDPAAGKLALIIQAMIEPQTAGVVFTLDPTDATRTFMRIGYVAGRGEALVQGEAGEDMRTLRHGMVRTTLPWLPPLRDIAMKLERHFGRALDLEFAYDGRLHLVQARPIASLPPGAEARPPIRWSRDLAEERFPDPISPMGWSVLQPAFRTNLRVLDQRFGLAARRPDDVARVIGGRVYNNRDFFKVPGSMRFRAAAHLPFVGAYVRQAFRLLAPNALAGLGLLRGPKRGPLGASPRDPRFLATAGVFEAFVFHHAAEVEAAWTRDFPTLMERMDKLAEAEFEPMDDAALLGFIDQLLVVCDDYMEPDLAIYVIKMACRWLVDEAAVLAGGDRAHSPMSVLTGGLEANATLAMNEAIEALAVAVAGDAYLSTALRLGDRPGSAAAWERSAARPLRDGFMKAYGHVTLSWDLRVPTYGERPELLEDLLAQRLRVPGAGRVADRRAALAALREAETDRLAVALAPASWAPAFFRKLLGTLHTFMRLDEEHHLFCARMVPTDRRLVLDLGRRFVDRGVVEAADDVFFLTLDEAQAILREPTPFSRKRLVARRRAAFERAQTVQPADEYLDDMPVAAEAAALSPSGALVGQPASPGVVEGRVRIVDSMADMAAFQPGEILVAPTPKPSYTPLFAVAAGLITARGSTLSHGLITAREYGLPAVTELHDALARLQTGQRVRLDGSAGTVLVLADSPVLPFGGRR